MATYFLYWNSLTLYLYLPLKQTGARDPSDHPLLVLLTEREREIAILLVSGKSNVQIAETLFISVATVKFHVKNIFEKTQKQSRFDFIQAILN